MYMYIYSHTIHTPPHMFLFFSCPTPQVIYVYIMLPVLCFYGVPEHVNEQLSVSCAFSGTFSLLLVYFVQLLCVSFCL